MLQSPNTTVHTSPLKGVELLPTVRKRVVEKHGQLITARTLAEVRHVEAQGGHFRGGHDHEPSSRQALILFVFWCWPAGGGSVAAQSWRRCSHCLRTSCTLSIDLQSSTFDCCSVLCKRPCIFCAGQNSWDFSHHKQMK